MEIKTKFNIDQEVVVIEDLKYSRPFKISCIDIKVDKGIKINYLGRFLDVENEHKFFDEAFLFSSTEEGKEELIRRVQGI